MGYLNEDGLVRYDELIKQWVTFKSGTVDGIDNLLNWQRTAVASSVAFYPLPAAPLDPVVSFAFTETGPAEGEKSPTNPSTITGVTQAKVTRCGKNLVPQPSNGTAVRNGVTFVVADGVFTATGTAGSGNAALYIATATGKDLRVVQGHTYCLSGCPAGGTSSTYYINANIYDDNGNAIAYNVLRDYGSGATYTAPSNGWLTVYIGVVSGVEVSGLVFKPQIEDGTSATVFESSESTVYTIPFNGTYYGGSVDVSAGTMTVTRYGMVLDGTEAWYNFKESATAGIYRMQLAGLPEPQLYQSTHCIFTHYVYNGSDSAVGPHAVVYVGGALVLWDTYTTIDAFKAFLAEQYANGTPVKLTYNLLNPYTVQLTPTQIYSLSQPDLYTPRTNTVYSDQVSVQVGYPKSPLATSTELTNAIVSLGGNI